MGKMGFSKRVMRPVGSVFLVMAASYVLYMLSGEIPNYTLYQVVAILSGIALFVSLGLGALYVYPVAYVGGAGSGERIVASLVNPLIWMTKEVIVIGSVYTLTEALYYYLNPVHLLLLSAVVAEMGVCELLVRRRLKKDGALKRAISIPALAAVVLGLGWFAFMFIWDLGVHHFYIFQEGFKALFGYGIGV